MPTAIRAFLMLRSADSEWSVSVFRDLEELLRAWEGRETPLLAVGVIHVGFDRPPSRNFQDIATAFPGRALLTASAKYSLPDGFQTTTVPVGHIGELPIYLATRGWGYLADDIVPSVAQVATAATSAFDGWIAEYVGTSPATAINLQDAGIWSDADYLRAEAALSRDLRRELAVFRFRCLIGAEMHDPCAVSRALPPWLAATTIESLDVSVRIANVFERTGIRIVEDLGKHSLNELLGMQNFGRKSVNDLLTTLDSALVKGPPAMNQFVDESGGTLLASLRRSLLSCEPRERDIVTRRMGLNSACETLQEIGDCYGVSRERIRQIENKTVQRLVRMEVWDDLLTEKLKVLLRDREFPLPLLGIEASDSWFAGVGEVPHTVRYILENMCAGQAAIVQIDDIDYFGFLAQEQWSATLEEGRTILASAAEREWTEDHCKTVVWGLLPETSREFRSLLWEKSSRLCHFAESEPGKRLLKAYGRGAEQVVLAILQESDSPLHFTEIAELANARAGRLIDARRAHSAAASIGLLLGRGTYGLAKHLPVDSRELGILADEALEMVTEGAGSRQWHAAEILAGLVERGCQPAFAADKYAIDVALRNNGALKRLGRLVWAAPSATGEEHARIEVRQAVIAILQQAQRPLRTMEIRQRLIALRGLGQDFQMLPADPLIRVGPATWGLNDRDVTIKRPAQQALREEILDVLRALREGVHISELGTHFSAAAELSGEALFSLAVLDPRLRASFGRYLYMADWEGPRRETATEAVALVLDGAEHPVTLGELSSRVEARIGRSCDRRTVSGCLQALEAILLPDGRWTSPRPSVIDSDDEESCWHEVA